MRDKIDYLNKVYGSHSHVAAALGHTPRRYREIRRKINNGINIPEWTLASIDNLYQLAKLQEQIDKLTS